MADGGRVGLGFVASLFHPLPALAEIERVFREEAWPSLEGQPPAGLIHRVGAAARRQYPPHVAAVRGGHQPGAAGTLRRRRPVCRSIAFSAGTIRACAPTRAASISISATSITRSSSRRPRRSDYRGYKIKVGHPDLDWDIQRLTLLREAVGDRGGPIMVDANEAWSPREAVRRLDAYRRAGFDIYWIEDPCLRDDFDGLREVRAGAPWAHVNSGEYLDLRGKRKLMEARAVDILNVHGNVTDVMRAGWLAAEHGIPVSLGNTMLELGVHMAAALPHAGWLEYSFQNYNHLVEEPISRCATAMPSLPIGRATASRSAKRRAGSTPARM